MAENLDPNAQRDQTSPETEPVVSQKASRRGLLKMMAVGGAGVAAASVLHPGVTKAAPTRVVRSSAVHSGISSGSLSRPRGRINPGVRPSSVGDNQPINMAELNLDFPASAETDVILGVDPLISALNTQTEPASGILVYNPWPGGVALAVLEDGSAPVVAGRTNRIGIAASTYFGPTDVTAAIGNNAVPSAIVASAGFAKPTAGVAATPENAVAIAGTVAGDVSGASAVPIYSASQVGAGVAGSAGDPGAGGVNFLLGFLGYSGVIGESVQPAADAAANGQPAVGVNGRAGGPGVTLSPIPGTGFPGSIGVLATENSGIASGGTLGNGRAVFASSSSPAGIGVSAFGDTGGVFRAQGNGIVNNNVGVLGGVVGIVDADPGNNRPAAGGRKPQALPKEKAVAKPTLHVSTKARWGSNVTATNAATVFNALPKGNPTALAKSLKSAAKITAIKVKPAVSFAIPTGPAGTYGITTNTQAAVPPLFNTVGVFASADPADLGGVGVFGSGTFIGGQFVSPDGAAGFGLDVHADVTPGSFGTGANITADIGVVVDAQDAGVIATTTQNGSVAGSFDASTAGGIGTIGVIASGDIIGVEATGTGANSFGVEAIGDGVGVVAIGNNATSVGVLALGTAFGVLAVSGAGGTGVLGSSGSGGAGVEGTNDTGDGVIGSTSSTGTGVVGLSNVTGGAGGTTRNAGLSLSAGVYGATSAAGAAGVVGDGQLTAPGVTGIGGGGTRNNAVAAFSGVYAASAGIGAPAGAATYALVGDGQGAACGLLVNNGATINAGTAPVCPITINGPVIINGPVLFTGQVTFVLPPKGAGRIIFTGKPLPAGVVAPPFQPGQQCVTVTDPFITALGTSPIQFITATLTNQPNSTTGTQLNAIEAITPLPGGGGFTICLARPVQFTTNYTYAVFLSNLQ